jgi:hypothetical protein
MLTFEETFKILPQTGWLTIEEARLLWDTASSLTGDVLEIGTYCGRSARLLAEAVSNEPGRRLYCCDPWTAGFDGVATPDEDQILLSVLNSLCRGPTAIRVHLCRMTEEALRAVWPEGRRLSMVYIDGDHSAKATGMAIDHWAPITDVVVFHDYGGNHHGVAQSIRERVAKHRQLKSRPIIGGRVAVFR